jgi:hypothetical protein
MSSRAKSDGGDDGCANRHCAGVSSALLVFPLHSPLHLSHGGSVGEYKANVIREGPLAALSEAPITRHSTQLAADKPT